MARPGKVSERQYLGDLAGLFERQRRRTGVALTPDSFAADLAANDALRSGLFTLCNAISHMGEQDLSPEELLDLIARALSGAASAEGETGTQIPADMREAFLSGYSAWQNRDTQAITAFNEPEDWPPVAPAARKPPAREMATDAIAAQQEIAANGSVPGPAISGRRTVQEAIGLARRRPEAPDLPTDLPGGPDTGSMTLGELKHFLEDIEHRVSRIAPHLQQLKSATREPARYDRERPALLPDGVIPFPDRRAKPIVEFDEEWLAPVVKADPRRSAPSLSEDTTKAQSLDDRPPGIDALVAKASTWANSVPTARSFDEEAFLSRHSYLAPSRRPGASAPASLYYAETPAQPLAPPPAALPVVPIATPRVEKAIASTTPAASAPTPTLPALIGLDVEEDPLLSPLERVQAYMLRLPPRKVFIALASLTVLAGCLAGFMAYHTLHGHAPQFKDLEPAVRFGGTPDATTIPDATAPDAAAPTAPAGSATPPVQAVTPTPTVATPVIKPTAPTPVVASHPKPHLSPAHTAVAVWPPVPQIAIREVTPAGSPATASAPATTPQPSSSAALFVPAPTMIGYALATPQPAPRAHGVGGTVSVEITVSRLGDVTSARAVSGPSELYPSAVAAVRGWRFRPYLVDGKPALVSTTLQFFFKGE